MLTGEREHSEGIDDLVAGRWLAWIGGVATLVGICLLLGLAVSHGWLGHTGRIVLAALGASGLAGGGFWLRERHGRIEAPAAMVLAGVGAWLATLVVAADVYHVIPGVLGSIGVVLVAGGAAAVAVRWRSTLLGAMALIAPLVAGPACGPGSSALDLPLIIGFSAGAQVLAVRQRWAWIACALVVLSEFDVALWLANAGAPSAGALAMVPLCAGALVTAAGLQHRAERRLRAALTLLVASAFVAPLGVVAVLGLRLSFSDENFDPALISVALLVFAAAHLALVAVGTGRRRSLEPLASTALALATLAIDATLAINLHGIALTAGLGGSTLALAAIRRHRAQRTSDRALADIGLCGHVGIVLVRALLSAPPTTLAHGGLSVTGAAGAMILAAICLVGAHSTPRADADRGVPQVGADGLIRETTVDGFLPAVLGALGLAAVGYLTAATMSGPALVAAWGAEAVALAGVHRRQRDWLTGFGAVVFLIGAWGHTLTIEAPPWALLTGASSLSGAVLALVSCAVATETIRRQRLENPTYQLEIPRAGGADGPLDLGERGLIGLRERGLIGLRERGLIGLGGRWPLAVVAIVPLYLASVAIITLFQPAMNVGLEVLDLNVRQQGQVLMSALWTLSGLVSLIVGVRRSLPGLLRGGLILLLVAAAKVFLYDMATLTSVYRVVSFIVLGLLLMVGAYAYQRLRPPALPDLRDTAPFER